MESAATVSTAPHWPRRSTARSRASTARCGAARSTSASAPGFEGDDLADVVHLAGDQDAGHHGEVTDAAEGLQGGTGLFPARSPAARHCGGRFGRRASSAAELGVPFRHEPLLGQEFGQGTAKLAIRIDDRESHLSHVRPSRCRRVPPPCIAGARDPPAGRIVLGNQSDPGQGIRADGNRWAGACSGTRRYAAGLTVCSATRVHDLTNRRGVNFNSSLLNPKQCNSLAVATSATQGEARSTPSGTIPASARLGPLPSRRRRHPPVRAILAGKPFSNRNAR